MGRRGEYWRRAVPWWVSAAIFVAYLHCLAGHAPVGWSAAPISSLAGAHNVPDTGGGDTEGRVSDPAGRSLAVELERPWVSWVRWLLDPTSGESGPLQSTCHNESGCICRGATLTAPVLPNEPADDGIWLNAADARAASHSIAVTATFTVDQMRLSLAGDPAQCASRPWRSWHPVYRL